MSSLDIRFLVVMILIFISMTCVQTQDADDLNQVPTDDQIEKDNSVAIESTQAEDSEKQQQDSVHIEDMPTTDEVTEKIDIAPLPEKLPPLDSNHPHPTEDPDHVQINPIPKEGNENIHIDPLPEKNPPSDSYDYDAPDSKSSTSIPYHTDVDHEQGESDQIEIEDHIENGSTEDLDSENHNDGDDKQKLDSLDFSKSSEENSDDNHYNPLLKPQPDQFQNLEDHINDLIQNFKPQKWFDHGNYNQEGQIEFNGFQIRCLFGCKNCTYSSNSSNCQTCLDGFTMDVSNSTCQKCNDICLTCSSSNVANCASCYPGWAIKSVDSATNTCAKCADTNCGLCSTVGTCTTCKNSFYIGTNSQCAGCLSNCKICTDNLSCAQCYNGYFVNTQQDGSQSCKLCSDGCASCTKLTDCQKCYPGFFLDSTTQTCQKCSQNCWKCNSSSSCTRCIIGTFLVGNVCVNHIDYCAVMNENGTCNKCFWGYSQNQNQNSCLGMKVIDFGPIQDMVKQFGCKMREVMNGTKCQECNATFPNCQDCNTTKCLRCVKGSILSSDGTTCTACNSTIIGCKKCQNSIFCAECSKGYYMEQDSNENQTISYGNCLKCNENCLACNEKSDYCTSCPFDFSLTTSRSCMPLNQFNFTLLLNLDLATFTSKMSQFKSELIKLINDPSVSNSQKEKFIQIRNITTGSIKVEGTMSSSSPSAIQSTKRNFDTAIATGSTFAGIKVLSTRVTPIKYDSSTTQSNPSQTTSNTGMIVGIAVGVSVAVLIGVVVVYFLCRKKNEGQNENDRADEKRTTTTVDDIAIIDTIQSNHGIQAQYPQLQKGKKSHQVAL